MTLQSAEGNPTVLSGLAASPGVVIGEVFRIHDRVDIPRYNIPANGVPAEIHRFFHAVKQVKKDLRAIRQRLHLDEHRDGADIFQAHIMMLEDPTMVERIRIHIATHHVNAEAAVADVGAEFIDVFSQSETPYFRERSVDLNDLVQQLVSLLMGEERLDLFNQENEVNCCRTQSYAFGYRVNAQNQRSCVCDRSRHARFSHGDLGTLIRHSRRRWRRKRYYES